MQLMIDKVKVFWQECIRFPKYIVFHPFDGYDDFKRYGKAKMWVAVVFYALYFLYRIFDY